MVGKGIVDRMKVKKEGRVEVPLQAETNQFYTVAMGMLSLTGVFHH